MSTNWQGSVFTQAVTFDSPWVLSSLTHSKDGFHFKVDDKCSFPPIENIPHPLSFTLSVTFPPEMAELMLSLLAIVHLSQALMVHGRVSIQRQMAP